MDRRVFFLTALVAPLALAGCGGAPTPVVCDPDLAPALDRALASRGRATYRLEALTARPLLARAEASGGLLVATREPKLADRLQRLGLVRIQNRWKLEVGGAPVHLVVTTGAGEAAAAHLAKWLAGEEAARRLSDR
jgi:hypothetical protein